MISRFARLLAVVASLTTSFAECVCAQAAPADSTKCDSIVAAAKVDSVCSGLFMSVQRRDGASWLDEQALTAASTVSLALVLPRPFRLTVFSGAPRTHFLRTGSDTAASLRSPAVAGIYR